MNGKTWIIRMRAVWPVLALAFINGGCGMLSDDDDALFYDSFFFTGRHGADDFHDCYVEKEKGGLEKIYVSIDGGPGKRAVDLKWDDFGPIEVVSENLSVAGREGHQTFLWGTPDHGTAENGARIEFVNGKVTHAHFRPSDWQIGRSAEGPFI